MAFLGNKKKFLSFLKILSRFSLTPQTVNFILMTAMAKQKGSSTYVGVSLKDLNTYFKEDAVIQVSKKFMQSYEMITGITATPKPISMKVVDKNDDIKVEKIDTSIKEKEEIAPAPIELNVNNGDW